jgi:hypothetical protein
MLLGWCFALLFLLAAPSSNISHFDGLPLSGGFEFAAFLVILPFLLWVECRNEVERIFHKLALHPVWMWALPLGILFVKGVLFFSGAQAGWDACYQSPAPFVDHYHGPATMLDCERSYENVWGLSPGTRTDSIPSYRGGITVPVFMNTLRYDYYSWEQGSILRNRLPVRIQWRASVSVPASQQIDVRYVGEGYLSWGDKTYRLAPSYQEPAIVSFFPSSSKTLPVVLEYHFDDGTRSGQDLVKWGPLGLLSLTLPDHTDVNPSAWTPLGWIMDSLWLLVVGSLLAVLIWVVRKDSLPVGVAVVFAVVVYRVSGVVLVREACLTAIMVGIFLWHNLQRRMHPVAVYAVVIMLGLLMVRIWHPAWDLTVLRSAGNDPLGFESQAYAILAGGNLEGGEPVFYAQPLYRYIKFVEHLGFGDGDVLYAGLQAAAFLGGVWMLFSRGLPTQNRKWQLIIWYAMGCTLLCLGGYYVSQIIREALPEYITWTLLIWGAPMLFLRPSRIGLVIGMAMLAVAAITRTNQIPGLMCLIFMAGVLAWRQQRKVVIAGVVLAMMILALPLAHNMWFGHAPVLFTTSAGVNTNLIAPPAIWAAGLLGDSSARVILWEQLSLLFLISAQPPAISLTLVALAACAFFYAVTIFRAMCGRCFPNLFLLAAPILFLLPHLMYVVQTYYPRHIVIIYLSMATLSAVVWLRGSTPRLSASVR